VTRVTFQTHTPVLKFSNPGPKVFKFEKPTPVQTPVSIIDPTEIYPYFTKEITTQTPATAEIEK